MQIHGKEYVEVKDRIAAALADAGYAMLAEDVFEMAERVFVRIAIEVKGKQYIGTAEAKFVGAKPGSADASNPMECAETSALGRALGFAGYGIVESIASADEVSRATGAKANVTPMLSPAEKLANSRKQAIERGLVEESQWEAFKADKLGAAVADSAVNQQQYAVLYSALKALLQAASAKKAS